MADDVAKTDLWLDRESGKVVKKQPARGTLLAREGSKISGAAQTRLDAMDADPDAEPVAAHEALGHPVEAAIDDGGVEKAVTSDSAKPAAKRTRKSSK